MLVANWRRFEFVVADCLLTIVVMSELIMGSVESKFSDIS